MASPTRAMSAATAHHPAVGTWTEELLLDRGTYSSTLRFTPQGRALLLAGPRPGCVGAGTWYPEGPGIFTFRLVELVFDDGEFTGWIDIEQEVVLDGDTFRSTGTSRVHDHTDALLERAEVEARGRRTG